MAQEMLKVRGQKKIFWAKTEQKKSEILSYIIVRKKAVFEQKALLRIIRVSTE